MNNEPTTTAARDAKTTKRAFEDGVVIEPLFRHRGKAVGVSGAPIAAVAPPAQRPLPVARMLALAHEIVRLSDVGTFADQADAARVLGFTRARISQFVDLTMLAPKLPVELLFVEFSA